MEKILPTVLIVIDVCASVPYFVQGDWRLGFYWIFAGGLTFCVTW